MRVLAASSLAAISPSLHPLLAPSLRHRLLQRDAERQPHLLVVVEEEGRVARRRMRLLLMAISAAVRWRSQSFGCR